MLPISLNIKQHTNSPSNAVPTVPTTINRGNVESALNTLCGSTCYSQARELFRCLGGEQYFTSGICGRRNGVFCILSLIQDNNMPVEVPLCAPGTSCSSDCSASLSQASDRLGCCAAGLYYNTTSNPLSVFGRQYTLPASSAWGRRVQALPAFSTSVVSSSSPLPPSLLPFCNLTTDEQRARRSRF